MPLRSIAPRLRFILFASGLGLLLTAPGSAQALNPPYLVEMPTVDRVLADTKGSDPLDTLARQNAALAQLQQVVHDMGIARNVSGALPDETRIVGNYWDGITKVQAQAKAITGPPAGAKSPWAKWMALEGKYERDPDERAATLQRYLSADFRHHLTEINADTYQKVEASKRAVLKGLRNGKADSWEDMTKEEQQGAIAFGILVLILLAIQLIREFRHFGIDPKDATKLRTGFRVYSVQMCTGIVTEYTRTRRSQRRSTTYVNNQTGESNTVTDNSTWDEESFFLNYKDGRLFVAVTDAKVDIANGRVVTAFWGIRRKQEFGDYFLFIDHTTDRIRPHATMLPKMLAPRKWLIVPLGLLGFLVGSSSNIFMSWLPLTNDLLRGLVGMWIAGVAAFVGIVYVSHKRKRRMMRRDRALLLKSIQDRGDLSPEHLNVAPAVKP